MKEKNLEIVSVLSVFLTVVSPIDTTHLVVPDTVMVAGFIVSFLFQHQNYSL